MFRKIIVVEDHGLTGRGLKEKLYRLQVPQVTVVHYCDDAIIKLKGAQQQREPYDLMITDLSFKTDFREQKLTSGEELIVAARRLQPQLKVMVYSVESRVGKIQSLFHTLHINGFVGKDREDLHEMGVAITAIAEGKPYLSHSLQQAMRNLEQQLELDSYDIHLLRLLAQGWKQEEISQIFQEKNYPASSLRSIQERLSKLKTVFSAKNPVHLVAQAMERGFI